MIIAFPWFGGKYRHLPWLLPLLPAADTIDHYVEPFCGSAAVLLNRERAPLETINDLDDEVPNFFRVLREQELELTRAIMLTPYSRSEYRSAKISEPTSAVDKARMFMVRARQSFGHQSHDNTGWARRIRPTGGGDAATWIKAANQLHAVAERLSGVQIENKPAIRLIKEMDSPAAFFYVDPPYPWNARARGTKRYKHEMANQDHSNLAELLRVVQGKVAVSGYRCELLDSLYRGWRLVECPKSGVSVKNTKLRHECLYVNYDQAAQSQGDDVRSDVRSPQRRLNRLQRTCPQPAAIAGDLRSD